MDEGTGELLAAVVAAMEPESIHRLIAARVRPQPTLSEVSAVLRLLGEPAVGFRLGEQPQPVLERIRELDASIPPDGFIQ